MSRLRSPRRLALGERPLDTDRGTWGSNPGPIITVFEGGPQNIVIALVSIRAVRRVLAGVSGAAWNSGVV